MLSNIFYIVIYLTFILLALIPMKKVDTDGSPSKLLERLNSFRGLFAFEIVIGHIVRDEFSLLYPFGLFMICSVGYFFFVSSFGIRLSLEKKGSGYLSFTFIRKPLYLFLLALSIYILNIIIDIIVPLEGGYFGSLNILYNFFVSTNWYLWELIGFYFAFWVLFKFLRKGHSIILLILTCIFIYICYWFKLERMWYASAICFPLGLLYYEYFSFINKFICSIKGYITLIILFFAGALCLMIPSQNFITLAFMRNVICIAVVLLLALVCSTFDHCQNPIASFLKKYSTELYLCQFVWLRLFDDLNLLLPIRIILTSISTFCFALLFHLIVLFINKMLDKVFI